MAESRLTDRQRAFVEGYLVDLNGAAAAVRAGCKRRTANRLLTGTAGVARHFLALVVGEYLRLRASKVYVESGGTQEGAAQIIRRHQDPHMNVIEVPISGQGDKLVRASAFVSLAEAGNLNLPADDPTFGQLNPLETRQSAAPRRAEQARPGPHR